MLGRGFRGERLPDARRPEQVDDKPVTLAFDKIVETEVRFVRLDKRAQERLTTSRQHQLLKRLVVPINFRDPLDVEFDCKASSDIAK